MQVSARDFDLDGDGDDDLVLGGSYPTDRPKRRSDQTPLGLAYLINETRAVIAADGRVSHSEVVKVIDLLRQEKVTKFASYNFV